MNQASDESPATDGHRWAPLRSLGWPVITAPAVCVTMNYAVGWVILNSQWGSVLMMDDQFSRVNVVVPLVAGLVLGCVQAVVFGFRATLIAAGVNLLAVATLVLAFTLLTQAVGIITGCLAVFGVRAMWVRFRPGGN